jgi:hypothetical protein
MVRLAQGADSARLLRQVFGISDGVDHDWQPFGRGIRARHEAALLYSIDLIIWDGVKVFAVEKAA